jgi:hypothetical protein
MISIVSSLLVVAGLAPQNATLVARADTTGKRVAAAPAPQVTAVRIGTGGGISLDGELGEAAWSQARPMSDFTQRDPDEGKQPSQRTEVRVVYDDGAIYVGAELLDTEPGEIRAQLARRDYYVNADRFMVFLDPYHDRRTGFYFAVNAAGTQYDGTLYNDDWDDDTWDGVWESAVKRTDRGWTVEMRIPYSQLRFEKKAEHVWGINFKREIARLNEQDYLVFTPKNGSGFVSRFRDLAGIRGVNPPRRLEVLPYATAKAEFLPGRDATDPFNDGSRYSPGVGADLKLGIGSNLTVDATVNPDFGQVEQDPAVVNLSDSETFFNEKRPFFIEGANIFDFGSGGANNFWGFNNPSPDFFYTRRIGRRPQVGADVPEDGYSDTPLGARILGAAKISGKIGDWSLGGLSALTNREHTSLSDATGRRWNVEAEPLTHYGVARLTKEFGQGRQGLGFLATSVMRDPSSQSARELLTTSAHALAVDGWLTLDSSRTWVLTGWLGASRVDGSAAAITSLQENPIHYLQRPDADHVELDPLATSLSGLGGRVTLNKQKGNFYSNTAVAFVSPGMDVNDLGFQWTADVVNAHQVVGYRWRQPTSWYRYINWNAAYSRSHDFGGNKVHDMLWTGVSGQFKNFWWWGFGGNYLFDRMNNRRTRGGPLTLNPKGGEMWLDVGSDDRKPVVVSMNVGRSKFSQGSSDSWWAGTTVEWKPMDRVSLSFSPEYQRSTNGSQYVDQFDDAGATRTFGRRYLFADLEQKTVSASFRVNAIVSPKLSIEAYAQPFISSVDYGALKSLAAPRTYDFEAYDDADGDYAGLDFTYTSLRGSAVMRWEYLPGSTLFLVWQQNRELSNDVGRLDFGRSVGDVFGGPAANVFLVKLSYWWNP